MRITNKQLLKEIKKGNTEGKFLTGTATSGSITLVGLSLSATRYYYAGVIDWGGVALIIFGIFFMIAFTTIGQNKLKKLDEEDC